VSLKFVAKLNAGPSTAFGRRRPDFAQGDSSFSGADFELRALAGSRDPVL
jgi:hypothetical protein